MFIVMHCMGLPFNGETINTKSLGGSETAAYYMAKELAAKGHEVTLFTNIDTDMEGTWDGVRYVSVGSMSQQAPLGERFHFYAANTPHDVLIIQRHPQAFAHQYAAKVKLWWVHDLAMGRQADMVRNMLWNVDGILTVSEFHKQQYAETYGINPDIIYPIQNGIDLELFSSELDKDWFPEESFKLLYTSRPERGLEHLIMPGGIMERLADQVPDAHLYVCGYENTTEQTKDYYEYLWSRCEKLPNVTNLGALTKQQLADVMRQCDLLVYPTPGPQQPDFEEVSCITAMEAMAAGLPMLASDKGALSETCKDSGSMLLELNENGMPDLDKFVGAIVGMYYDSKTHEAAREIQLKAAEKYGWVNAAEMLEAHIGECFARNRTEGAMARYLMDHSDIYALEKYLTMPAEGRINAIAAMSSEEMDHCYDFALNEETYFGKHYKEYYQYEEDRGVDYGPEELKGNGRFESVADIVASLPAGSHVLDYGCAHGHYTINLAKRLPETRFTGVDITASNIDKAKAWADSDGVENASFVHGSFEQPDFALTEKYDAIIAAEVIEHVGDPQRYVDRLLEQLEDGGRLIITVPYGPWEAMGYKEHWPWRAHLWHFERQDLQELWGHMPGYQLITASSGRGPTGEVLGSYIVTFKKPSTESQGAINYDRKFAQLKPRQTVSLCMIVKDAENTIRQAIDSVVGVVDEVIIAVDETTTDGTHEVLDKLERDQGGYPWPLLRRIDIKSPMEIGFDEARNQSIAEASGDWILWMDADEVMVNAENMRKYLQNNQYDGYAVNQHHFSVEPLGVLKTDMPCRLFRNGKGMKFFGKVHEHPEKALNEGVGYVQLLPDLHIAHNGYQTEAIRRGRFNRNIQLLAEDRKVNPDRTLGKFLWIRDLAQMIRYELEQNGGRVLPQMQDMAREGIGLWEELLKDAPSRMLIDSLDFYSSLVETLGGGFEVSFSVDVTTPGEQPAQPQVISGRFATKWHLRELWQRLLDEKSERFESKYY